MLKKAVAVLVFVLTGFGFASVGYTGGSVQMGPKSSSMRFSAGIYSNGSPLPPPQEQNLVNLKDLTAADLYQLYINKLNETGGVNQPNIQVENGSPQM